MTGGVPASRRAVSQFCERRSRTRAWLIAALAAGFLGAGSLAPQAAMSASLEEDYQRGERAYRSGDVVTAMAALRRAAEQGHAPSQVLLAEILDRAEFDEEALAWYRKAAEQGDPAGEYGVGAMVLAGEGVKKDPQQAWFWFARAGEKKFAPAIIAMANAHIQAAQGNVAPGPDASRAGEWLRRAAEIDYLPAVEALAHAYRDGGFGLERNGPLADRYAAQAESLKKKLAGSKGGKKR